MSVYRLSGQAGAVRTRSGVKKDGSGEVWSMREQDVKVSDLVVTTINLSDDETPLSGEVDVAVDVSARGGYLSTRVIGPYPKQGSHAAPIRSAS